MENKIFNTPKKYILVTHFYADGPAQFLNKYLIEKKASPDLCN